MSDLKFRKAPRTLESRLKIAENEKFESICHGTAFFLLGILPYDINIFTNNDNECLRKALRLMEESDKPKNNSIMIFYGKKTKEIYHSAFIKTAKPFKGYQREGFLGPFKRIDSLTDVENYLRGLIEIPPETEFFYRYYKASNPKKLLPWAKEMVRRYKPWG